MRRGIAGVVAVVAAGVLAAGCSGGGDGGASASKSPSAAPKLAAKWTKRIDAVQDKAGDQVCTNPGVKKCATHLSDLVIVVGEVEQVIDDAGAREQYPRAVKRIAAINKASDAYTKHRCLGSPDAAADDSPCAKDMSSILVGATTLTMEMVTDEAKRG